VPTLKQAIGSNWQMAAWRGIVAPKGIPNDVRDKLAAVVQKVANSREYHDFMASRGFGVVYAGPAEFGQFMAKSDAELGATMKAVGIAK
jgi:tripartite-type tricarboxylate transporter receptor subunit TctC